MTEREAAGVIDAALADGRLLDENGPLDRTGVAPFVEALAGTDLVAREAVGLSFDNGAACLFAYAALAARGLVAVPLPPTVPETERRALWRRSGCRYSLETDGLETLEPASDRRTLWPEEVDWVVHSSGSTGTPKAIAVTLSALRRNAEDAKAILGTEAGALHLGSMSQCYTNGLYNAFLLPLLVGERVLVGPVASGLNLRHYMNLIRQGQPRVLWVNPAVLKFLNGRIGADVFDRKAVLISCTAPLSAEEAAEMEAALERPVLQSYGLSETMIVSIERPGRNVETEFSAGVPLGGADSLSVDELERLVVQNGAVTPGYARVENGEVSLSLPDGGLPGHSFVSQDLAQIDSAGNLLIVGRTSSMINVQGVKVSAERLEQVLSGDPSVRQAAVLPVPDRLAGERPLAVITANGQVDSQALTELCVTHLGAKARPIAIRVTDHLPLTANGKIDRAELCRQFGAEESSVD